MEGFLADQVDTGESVSRPRSGLACAGRQTSEVFAEWPAFWRTQLRATDYDIIWKNVTDALDFRHRGDRI